MDNITPKLLRLRELINNKVNLVLAGGKYFERINPYMAETKKFYTIGQGTIWVALGNIHTERTDSLKGKKIKIFNTHGVYEIIADEDSLTGTFNQLECAYKDTDISKCQDNVGVKILDQFTISNQVAVKVDFGELKFGSNSVSLYSVKGEKEKLCDNGLCHIFFTETGKITKNNIANKTTQITIGKTNSVLNTVYTLDNSVDINQFKALVTYLSENGFSLSMRLKFDTYLIDSKMPGEVKNYNTGVIENNAVKFELYDALYLINIHGKLIPVYEDEFTDSFIREYFSSILPPPKKQRKNRRFK
jgi:hypothetical protein